MGPKPLVKTAYDRKSAWQYDERRFTSAGGKSFHEFEWEQLERWLPKNAQKTKILEVGCGSGRFTKLLAEMGYWIKAVDPSPHMVDVTTQKVGDFPNASVCLEQGARLESEDDSFDFVYSIRVTNQTESREYAMDMVEEMMRVTRPGGLVLVEFVNHIRPRRLRERKTTTLSFKMLESSLTSKGCNYEVLSRSGILISSFTLMRLIPEPVLSIWKAADRLGSRLFPKLAARCYLALRKVNG